MAVNAAPAPPSPVRMRIRVGMTASLMAVLLVVLSELDRLIGDVLDTEGRSWSATALMGVGIPPVDGWTATFTGPLTEARTRWFWAYLLLDLVLIATYTYAARTAQRVSWPALGTAVTVLAALDVLEDVGALVGTSVLAPAPTWLAWTLLGITVAKWLAVLAAGVVVLTRWRSDAGYRLRVRRWGHAVYRHRFSVLAVLPIAAIGVLPGSDLLDQLPDVQRRWLFDGAGHALAATAAVLVVSAGLLLLGRLRSTTIWNAPAGPVPDAMRADLRLAWLAPLAALVGVAVIWVRGSGTPLDMPGLRWVPLAVFAGLPLLVALASRWVRRRHDEGLGGAGAWFPRPTFRAYTPAAKSVVVRAGDLVATLALVIASLGLVRSYTAVLALRAVDPEATLSWAPVGWAAGALGAVLAWPAMRALTDALTLGPQGAGWTPTGWLQRLRATMSPEVVTPANPVVRLGLLAAGVALLLWIGLEPEKFAQRAGVIATATLALLAACLVVGGVVVVLEQRLSPELFWFRPITSPAVPVTTLMIAALALTSALGDDADIHGLRSLVKGGKGAVALADRPPLRDVVDAWDRQTASCGRTITVDGREFRVRPMFLVAAEGGGIRAAYWTAGAMDLLSGAAAVAGGGIDWTHGVPAACARPLLAGGASGGAVGLTVARFAGEASARDLVVTMSAPDALGQAAAGLFVRDLVYAATGLPVFGRPAHHRTAAGEKEWADRGGLMERVWASTAGLGTAFLPADQDDAATSRTGALVLNSTRVSDGCRMWVSQIDLGSAQGAECDSAGAPAGHTLDLLAALDPKGSKDGDDLCLGPIDAATGAMLASRFPFVTPSGVAGPCAGQPVQQFVDGGYVENSGLKTVVDLSPGWLSEVQRRNSAALATAGSGAAVPTLVVPVVLYLDNGTGTDLRVDPPEKTPELLVPQRTTGRAKASLVDTPALLREAERLVATDVVLPGGDELAALRSAVDAWRVHSVFVVHQSTLPAVTAPLGWVLSQQSIETMDRALRTQATNRAAGAASAGSSPVVSQRGSLADALALTSSG